MDRTIAALVIVVAASAVQAKDPRSQLTSVLKCETSASPAQVASLIKSLGGHTLVQAVPNTDVEYTLPNPIEVFSQPVSRIAVHPGKNTDGDFTEYRAAFDGPGDKVARYAGIWPTNGAYHREVGNNDLTLRFEPGVSYIVCANGVRSVTKSIKREWRKVTKTPPPPLD